MNGFQQDKKKAFTRSMVLSIMLVVGIPLTVVGAVMLSRHAGFAALLAAGIICVVAGFYGSPLSWVSFGNYYLYGHIIDAVENQHFYTVEELARYGRKPKATIKDALNKCIDRRYLTGYKFDGEKLTLNENEKLAPEQHSVICTYCGALVNFSGSVTTCPYCNAIVKYDITASKQQNDEIKPE